MLWIGIIAHFLGSCGQERGQPDRDDAVGVQHAEPRRTWILWQNGAERRGESPQDGQGNENSSLGTSGPGKCQMSWLNPLQSAPRVVPCKWAARGSNASSRRLTDAWPLLLVCHQRITFNGNPRNDARTTQWNVKGGSMKEDKWTREKGRKGLS